MKLKYIIALLAVVLCVHQTHAQNIVQAEYFFDTDPGFGNAAPIVIPTPGPDINNLLVNADASALSAGMHTMYIRTKDNLGQWSMTNNLVLAKHMAVPSASTVVNIDKAEYFFDTDPGFENGVNIPLTPAFDISNGIINADVTALSPGFHTMYVRVRNALGQWSIVNHFPFAKHLAVPGASSVVNIDKAEYFFDTDPGFENGVNIPLTPSVNLSNLLINADVTALSQGFHTMYVRVRDASGKWSVVNNYPFAKHLAVTAPSSLVNITKAEYFFDTDPGFENGVNIPLTPAFDISNGIINADVTALSQGFHTMYVRVRDASGKWSVVNNYPFAKHLAVTAPSSLVNITKAEYFFDTDPGFDNGVNIPITAALDIANLAVGVDVSTLASGFHTLYIRTADANGNWSETNSYPFAKHLSIGSPNPLANIARIEYFIDIDPGIGNATTVTGYTPATDVNNFSFNAVVSTVPLGPHTIYIRTMDQTGQWSITNHHSFNGGVPLPIKLLSFDAILQQDNTVMLEWQTAQEINIALYELERSTDGIHWEKIGETTPPSPNSNVKRQYAYKDEEPGLGLIYYRLRSNDTDGSFYYSQVRTIFINTNNERSIVVYPNPSNGQELAIELAHQAQKTVKARIISVGGITYSQHKITLSDSGTHTFSGLNLPPGNYFLILEAEGENQTAKFTVK